MTGFTSVMTRPPKRSAGGVEIRDSVASRPVGSVHVPYCVDGCTTSTARSAGVADSRPHQFGWRTDGLAPATSHPKSPKDTIFDSIQSTLEKG